MDFGKEKKSIINLLSAYAILTNFIDRSCSNSLVLFLFNKRFDVEIAWANKPIALDRAVNVDRCKTGSLTGVYLKSFVCCYLFAGSFSLSLDESRQCVLVCKHKLKRYACCWGESIHTSHRLFCIFDRIYACLFVCLISLVVQLLCSFFSLSHAVAGWRVSWLQASSQFGLYASMCGIKNICICSTCTQFGAKKEQRRQERERIKRNPPSKQLPHTGNFIMDFITSTLSPQLLQRNASVL